MSDHSEEQTAMPGSASPPCYAFAEHNGSIDLRSISETEEGVKWKVLRGSMGWKFMYPTQYSYDPEWERMLTLGRIVKVKVAEA